MRLLGLVDTQTRCLPRLGCSRPFWVELYQWSHRKGVFWALSCFREAARHELLRRKGTWSSAHGRDDSNALYFYQNISNYISGTQREILIYQPSKTKRYAKGSVQGFSLREGPGRSANAWHSNHITLSSLVHLLASLPLLTCHAAYSMWSGGPGRCIFAIKTEPA